MEMGGGLDGYSVKGGGLGWLVALSQIVLDGIFPTPSK